MQKPSKARPNRSKLCLPLPERSGHEPHLCKDPPKFCALSICHLSRSGTDVAEWGRSPQPVQFTVKEPPNPLHAPSLPHLVDLGDWGQLCTPFSLAARSLECLLFQTTVCFFLNIYLLWRTIYQWSHLRQPDSPPPHTWHSYHCAKESVT